MIKEAIEKIEEMVKPELIDVDDRTYSTKQIYPVRDPQPETIKIGTLTGLVDYVAFQVDLPAHDRLLLHIENFHSVSLLSSLYGSFSQRDRFALANCGENLKFPFGQFMDVESFIIRMQAMFVQDETTAAILKIVGNVGDGVIRNFSDDGVTQQAIVKTGVSRVADIPVPNTVELAPYRTFLEIKQPKSRFVFRMRTGTDSPGCALFEADGGTWKNEAIERIRDYLKGKVNGITIIA